MAKYLAQIIIAGTQIVARAFARAVREEVAASQDAARRLGSHKSTAERTANIKLGLSLEEAKQILNVSKLDPDEVTKRHDFLFKANERNSSGSFYIQSKVVRAKERLDMELENAQVKADETDRSSHESGEKT